MIRKMLDEETYLISFNSVKEFFEYTDTETLPADAAYCNRSGFEDVMRDHQSEWRFGADYTREGYFKARSNHDKGKKMCRDEVRKLMSTREYRKVLEKALTYRKRINFQDNGGRIDVPRAIAGDDRYFISRKNAAKPVVKLAMNMGVSGCVSDDELMQISLKTVPLIFALEAAGIATEVWLSTFTRDCFECVPFKYDVTEVKIKSAEHPFNWTMFAPLFCTGTFRYNFFKTWYMEKYQATSGLGSPMNEKQIKAKDNFGYAAIIGVNGPGSVDYVREVFGKAVFSR